MRLVFLGSPGVGKGTYAQLFKEKYSIPHISTGDLFREEIANRTPVGVKVKGFIDSGELVPDSITIEILKARISRPDCKTGFILDGFPRTVAQADALKKIVKVDRVVNFVADDGVIVERLGGRRTCSKCGAIFHLKNVPPKNEGICDKCGGKLVVRSDETPDAIKHRLGLYHKLAAPLVDYYRKEGLLITLIVNEDIGTLKPKLVKKLDIIAVKMSVVEIDFEGKE